MIRTLVITSLVCSMFPAARAQEQCTSHGITKRWLEQHGLSGDLAHLADKAVKGVRKGGSTPTIPVAVHVVWNTPAENVATAEITQMIATLNEDYQALNDDWDNVRATFANDRANPDILFCLAQTDPNGAATTGITRTQTSQTWFDPDTETDDMKSAPDGIAGWDPDHYLNIWICDISSGLGGGFVTAGYAYLPFGGVVGSNVDGIVLDYNYGLGSGSRTATHEVGHYLGLFHPWGDGGCGSDDFMDDTPTTDEATFSCANTGLMNCGQLTQYENFMDYADCSLMFTNDQSAQMNGVLFGDRISLLDNDLCGTIPNGPCIPSSAIGTAEGDYVDGVQLGAINNTATGSTTGADYQDYTAQSTDLLRGNTYPLIVTSGEYMEDTLAAWIDFDQSGTFEAIELIGSNTTIEAFEAVTFTFTVPMNATLGNSRLRVRCLYPDDGEPTVPDPCFNYNWGETEDYTVIIGTNVGVSASGITSIAVYPNPTENGLYVSGLPAGTQQLEVLDATGRTIWRSLHAGASGHIDTQHLADGQYLLRCSGTNGASLVPFVVRHTR